ncbi:hypothetical protein, partial [Hallella sp.]|uniref:hypothetical protein n=1 Tax=Hallella sp. TaxID=2980186 RepID=UPI002848B8AE
KRDEVPEGTLSCPDRNLAVFHHCRRYEGLRLLPSVCEQIIIQQTLINKNAANQQAFDAILSTFYRLSTHFLTTNPHVSTNRKA